VTKQKTYKIFFLVNSMNLGDLIRSGYRTGRVNFPGVDIEVEMPNNKYFKDDGFVDNMERHRKKLCDILNTEYIESDKPSNGRVAGTCSTFTLTSPEHRECAISSIYYLKLKEPLVSFVRGHEAVHAMMSLGAGNYFVEELQRYGLKIDPFKELNSEEQLADIGGILSLRKKNIMDKGSFDILNRVYRDDKLFDRYVRSVLQIMS